MKRNTHTSYLNRTVLILTILLLSNWSFGQLTELSASDISTINPNVTDPSVDDVNYDARKRGEHIQLRTMNKSIAPAQGNNSVTAATINKATSACFIPIDSSYTVLPRNDDGSFGPIALPFTFDLYGTSYTQVWINTNGNLTYTGPYTPFTASGFPFSQPMVAPFWADVDTRNSAGGQIHYKLSATNLIVTWDNVGYYSQAVDKLNEFQVVISDGFDPIVGIGQNVCFNYGDMQWTTGAASSGVSGFGGVPSTVGVNKGDGVDFYQLGRFGINSSMYDGPGGSTDGINYLDQQCYCAQAGSIGNIAPIANNFPSGTINVPCGDTFNLDFSFIPPEVNQTVSSTVDVNGTCGTTFTSTTGSISTVNFSLIGQACNEGTNVITFTGTDSANPMVSTTVSLTIVVDSSCCDLTANATGQDESCANQSDGSISVSTTGGTAPLEYSFDGGLTYSGSSTSTGLSTGTYDVIVKDAEGCESISQPITISGPTQLIASSSATSILCIGGSADITVSATGGTYPYNGTGIYSETVGTYTYIVTDANGCAASTTITLTEPTLLTAYVSCPVIACFGGTADLAVFAFGGMQPYTGDGVVNVGAGAYTFTVTDANGCTSDVSYTVTEPSQIVANITPENHVIDCIPIPVTLTANPTGGAGGPYSYSWSTGETTASISVNPDTTTTYFVDITDANGCVLNSGSNETTVNVLNRCGPNNQDVVICHVPNGDPSNAQTICISQSVLSSHLANAYTLHDDDYCGPCQSLVPFALIASDNVNTGENMFVRAGINLNNETINLSYRIGYDSDVRLAIYDMAGTLVDVVHSDRANGGELYKLKLTTNKISSGVYIYQFVTDKEVQIDKLQIIQ